MTPSEHLETFRLCSFPKKESEHDYLSALCQNTARLWVFNWSNVHHAHLAHRDNILCCFIEPQRQVRASLWAKQLTGACICVSNQTVQQSDDQACACDRQPALACAPYLYYMAICLSILPTYAITCHTLVRPMIQ